MIVNSRSGRLVRWGVGRRKTASTGTGSMQQNQPSPPQRPTTVPPAAGQGALAVLGMGSFSLALAPWDHNDALMMIRP